MRPSTDVDREVDAPRLARRMGPPMITLWDAAGFLASGLVIMAFCMKDIISLRAVALASNIAFLIYGIGYRLAPVWLLHAVLLPINCWRLAQGLSVRRIRRCR